MSSPTPAQWLTPIKHASPGNNTKDQRMSKPYISYIDPKTMKDAAMLAELERCRTYGTPRPESQAVRAHVPAVFLSFANSLRDVFHTRGAHHGLKEPCPLFLLPSG